MNECVQVNRRIRGRAKAELWIAMIGGICANVSVRVKEGTTEIRCRGD